LSCSPDSTPLSAQGAPWTQVLRRTCSRSLVPSLTSWSPGWGWTFQPGEFPLRIELARCTGALNVLRGVPIHLDSGYNSPFGMKTPLRPLEDGPYRSDHRVRSEAVGLCADGLKGFGVWMEMNVGGAEAGEGIVPGWKAVASLEADCTSA